MYHNSVTRMAWVRWPRLVVTAWARIGTFVAALTVYHAGLGAGGHVLCGKRVVANLGLRGRLHGLIWGLRFDATYGTCRPCGSFAGLDSKAAERVVQHARRVG